MEKPNNKVQKEEIDDFAKALLDKKTDMAIYANRSDTIDKTKEKNEDERKAAEQTLSSALDMLRKERGQSTIAEEEQRFYYNQLQEEDDDFTTSSIEELKTQSFDVNTVAKALHEYDQDQTIRTKLKVDLNKSNAKGVPHTTRKKEKPVKKKRSKKKIAIIAGVVVLFLACLGGYAYKIYVWDPAHIVTEAMQKSYDKLVRYADEYGSDLDSDATLMSDSERFELLDMDEDYDRLNATQKEEINDYFKEQTGKTYTSLVKELQQMRDEIGTDPNGPYQRITSLLTSWSSLSASQQYQLLDLESAYSQLSDKLQERIYDMSKANADMGFTELLENIRKDKEAADQQAAQQQQALSSLQGQLQSLQNQLASYEEYGQTLRTELATAQANGDSASISELNSAISSNDQTITRLEAQIASLQSQTKKLNLSVYFFQKYDMIVEQSPT